MLTRKFLKDNPKLLVLQADKGNANIIMEEQEYVEKAENMLSDSSTYVEQKLDPTSGVQKKSDELMKQFFERKWVDFSSKRYLTCYDSIPPKFCGLLNMHKLGFFLMPVLSLVKSLM